MQRQRHSLCRNDTRVGVDHGLHVAGPLVGADVDLEEAAGSGHRSRLQVEVVERAGDHASVEQVLQRGVLRVGMDTFQPWAMPDKTGQLIGFEIDVATRLAQDMGVNVEFVPTKWSGIIPALLTGKFDVIIGGMGIVVFFVAILSFLPFNFLGRS